METRTFIDLVGSGQSTNAVDALNELLAAKAFDALENKKREMASSLFNGIEIENEEQQEEMTNETE